MTTQNQNTSSSNRRQRFTYRIPSAANENAPSAVTRLLRFSVAPLAIIAAVSQALPAYATIDNTVTVTATVPGGGTINPAATENVDVADDAPAVTVVKAISFAPGDDIDGDGKADAGDKVTYTYTVSNSGNVTVADVTVSDAHDGAGTAPVVAVPASVTTDNGSAGAGTLGDSTDTVTGDGDWDRLGPGDVITFTSTYTVVAADLTGAGGGTGTGFSGSPEPDGYLDNTATVAATYDDGTGPVTVNGNDTRSIILDIQPSLSITKVADDDTDVVAGQLIAYTYTVTNNGNVPITSITLSDTHKGVVGALIPAFQSFTTNTGSTNTGNTINILQPGDVAVYTATYTVTQTDVDTLQ
jgi:large repetitive protein